MKSGKKELRNLLLVILAELFAVIFVVWFFDPFYQYHQPFFNRVAVLNDSNNQLPGTIRNFDYDSVLVGSSVVENCDTSFLDGAYGCQTLKVIKRAGSTADLLYYMDMVHEEMEPKNVFYCLDIWAFMFSAEVTMYGEDVPGYLHTESVWDDATYVLNKEILFEKIPAMLAYEKKEKNTGGKAYDWSEGKNFCAAQAMTAYNRPEEYLKPVDFSREIDTIQTNITMLVEEVKAHPNTTYRFFIPTASLLWWDCARANGILEEYYYVLEELMLALTALPNAELYDFQVWQDIACDLDYYMDMVHYSPEINARMLEAMVQGEERVTKETVEQYLERTKSMVEYMCTEKIEEYYPG